MKAILSDERAIDLLRDAIPRPEQCGPSRDLWPAVQAGTSRGLETGSIRTADWVLAAALVALCFLRPGLAGLLLLHF